MIRGGRIFDAAVSIRFVLDDFAHLGHEGVFVHLALFVELLDEGSLLLFSNRGVFRLDFIKSFLFGLKEGIEATISIDLASIFRAAPSITETFLTYVNITRVYDLFLSLGFLDRLKGPDFFNRRGLERMVFLKLGLGLFFLLLPLLLDLRELGVLEFAIHEGDVIKVKEGLWDNTLGNVSLTLWDIDRINLMGG